MADIFVSSVDGDNADSGASWALAKQTITGALAIAADGDVIKVDSAHSFTATAAITWTPPAGRVAIISVNRAGSDAWLAGASESVGAANVAFTVANAAASSMYVYGVTLNGATNSSSSATITLANVGGVSSALELVGCTLDLKTANATATIALGAAAGSTVRYTRIKLVNCTIIISGSRAGSGITVNNAVADFSGCTVSATGGSVPAQLFSIGSTASAPVVEIRDSTLSGYAGAAYFAVTNLVAAQITLTNVRLNATPTITTGTWAGGPGFITLRNVDSGNTIDSFEFRNAYGTLTENASIYAASGASFNSAGISWQIVTTSECNESFPFVCPWLRIWNTVTTAQTATVETIRDNATPLTDREIWFDLSYPNSASLPTGTTATDRNANPLTGTAVNQTSSSTSWTGTGGFSNPDKRTLDVALTTNVVGPVRGRPVVAKASTTLYVSPKLLLA